MLGEICEKAVLEEQEFEEAVTKLAFATLWAVVGTIDLAAALAKRERIRDSLLVRMDEVTAR